MKALYSQLKYPPTYPLIFIFHMTIIFQFLTIFLIFTYHIHLSTYIRLIDWLNSVYAVSELFQPFNCGLIRKWIQFHKFTLYRQKIELLWKSLILKVLTPSYRNKCCKILFTLWMMTWLLRFDLSRKCYIIGTCL